MGVSRIEDEFYSKRSSGEEIAEGMSAMVSSLLEQGMVKVKKGEIKLEDSNDILRLYAIWEKISDYQDVMNERDKNTTGVLPELSTKEAEVLGVEQSVDDKGGIVDSDLDKEKIDDVDPEELFKNLTDAMNSDNADSIKID